MGPHRGVEAHRRRRREVEALGAPADRDADAGVGGGREVVGDAVRLAAQDPGGGAGEQVVGGRAELGLPAAVGDDEAQPGRPQRRDGRVGRALAQDRQVEQAAHARADALRVVRVHGVAGEQHGVGARGVGGADDGARVARVGDPGEDGDEPGAAQGRRRVGVVAAAHEHQTLRVHGVGEARDRLVGDEGGADAGGPGADQQIALAVGHGVGDEEVDDGTRVGLGPGQGVVRGPHPLDEEAAGVLARRAPQQLAGCRDARGALGEQFAQAASSAEAPFGTSATAARAVSTSAVKAAASDTAISARFLRSISTPASFRPCMNRL